MSRLDDIYKLIDKEVDPTVDQALAAAFEHASEGDLARISQRLIDRGRPECLEPLIRHFDRVPEKQSRRILAEPATFARALRQAARSRQTPSVCHVIEIIHASRSTELLYLVSEHARHGGAATRTRAANCLLAFAEMTLEPGDAPSALSTADIWRIQNAIEESIGQADRYQPVLLQAWLTLAFRPMPIGLSLFSKPHHRAIEPLRQMLERPGDRATRRAMLLMLRATTLAPSVLDGLHRVVKDRKLGDVLEGAHLLRMPVIAKRLLKAREPVALVPKGDLVSSVPDQQAAKLPMWIAALPLPAHRQLAFLLKIGAAEDAFARLQAVRAIIDLSQEAGSSPEIAEALASFTFDGDAAISRLALRELMRVDWKGLPQLLPRLVNSAHDDVRSLAARRLAPIAFHRLWEGWPRLDETQRLAAGRALIKIDDCFHQQLSRRLRTGRSDVRLRALSIIHTLNQGSLFERALLALAHDKDVKVAASAVRALGGSDSRAAVITLEMALEHADSRVRANAIEALEQAESTRHVSKLLSIAQEDEGRPRANAIKALLELRTQDAVKSLERMLDDTRPGQRISALWLVDTLGLADVARQVAELSVSDPDLQVRSRAKRTIGHLLSTLLPPDPTTPGLDAAKEEVASSQPTSTTLLSIFAPLLPVLAVRDERVLHAVRDHWGESYLPMGWFLASLAVLGLGMLALQFRRKAQRRHLGEAPLLTFFIIASKVELSLFDQLLCRRIARHGKLSTPLTLLLSGGAFRHHALAWASTLRGRRRQRAIARIAKIGSHLFGDDWARADDGAASQTPDEALLEGDAPARA